MSLRIAVIATLAGLSAWVSERDLGFQGLVEADRHQRGHVERLADMSAAAADKALTTPGSGLAGDRRQPGPLAPGWRASLNQAVHNFIPASMAELRL
jgi:hypothetical protein